MTLPERLVALHRALARRRIPHAFGGAIALAYWTLDPRATSDIDVNVFIPAAHAGAPARALPPEIAQPPERRNHRGRGPDPPVVGRDARRPVPRLRPAAHGRSAPSEDGPFAGTKIPVLGPVELAAFKAMFDRTRDWADIEAMVGASTLDVDAVRATLEGLLPAGDGRFARLDEAVRRGAPV